MFQFSHLQLTEILIGYLNASFGSSVYRFYLSLNWFLFQRDDTPVMISCRLIFWEMQMLSPTGIFSTSLHHQKKQSDFHAARRYATRTHILQRFCSDEKLSLLKAVPYLQHFLCQLVNLYLMSILLSRQETAHFVCWSQLGFCGLTLMLVNINSNKGKQGAYLHFQ